MSLDDLLQRVQLLEEDQVRYKKEGMIKLAEFAAAKFGQNVDLYFPRFQVLYEDFHGHKQRSDQELEGMKRGIRQDTIGNNSKIDQIKIEVEKMKAAIQHQSNSIMDSPVFNSLQDQVRTAQAEIESLKLRMKNMPSPEKLESIEHRFREFITFDHFKDFSDNLHRRFCTQDQVTNIKDSIYKIDTKLVNYTTKDELKKVQYQVELNIDKKLLPKLSMEQFQKELEQVDKQFNVRIDAIKTTQNQNKNTFSQINRDFQHIQDDLKYLDEQVQNTVDREEGDKIWNHFKRFCKFDDMKDLYQKTVPEIQKFEQKLIDFTQDMEKNQFIVRRFDEIISDKASKMNIKEVYQHISQNVPQLNDFNSANAAHAAKIDESFGKIKHIEEMIDILGKQISKDIYTAVRRATLHLTKQVDGQGQSGGDSGILSETFQKQLQNKADRAELLQISNLKSNKQDTEISLRWIDVIHRQLKQLAILVTEFLKLDVDVKSTQGNQEHQKQNTKAFLFQQALLISQWMNKFDAENINDYYENQQPSQELEAFQQYVAQSLQQVDELKLSPNNPYLNQSIKLKSKSVLSNKNPNQPTSLLLVNNKVNYFQQRSKSKQRTNTLNLTLNPLGTNSGMGRVIDLESSANNYNSFSNRKKESKLQASQDMIMPENSNINKNSLNSRVRFQTNVKLRMGKDSIGYSQTAVNSPRTKQSLIQSMQMEQSMIKRGGENSVRREMESDLATPKMNDLQNISKITIETNRGGAKNNYGSRFSNTTNNFYNQNINNINESDKKVIKIPAQTPMKLVDYKQMNSLIELTVSDTASVMNQSNNEGSNIRIITPIALPGIYKTNAPLTSQEQINQQQIKIQDN
eukprot:403355004